MFIADTTALDPWLSYLWEVGATDLHMSVGSTPRVRVDGKLRAIPDVGPSTKNQLDQFHNGLLSPEDLAEYDVARQLDYSFSWREHARFRANSYYQMGVPALALRLIPTDIPSPEQLGLPEACAALVKKPHGLVLVTGPTGSGKSTTLAAMVSAINQTRPVHILTIEDPIEYVHYSATALVNQREVGGDTIGFHANGLGDIRLPRPPEAPAVGAAALAFRPHQVSIRVRDEQTDASRLWVDGVVESAEFLGEFSRYRVRAGEVALITDQPHYAGVPLFPTGAQVRLGIEPTQLRFLQD